MGRVASLVLGNRGHLVLLLGLVGIGFVLLLRFCARASGTRRPRYPILRRCSLSSIHSYLGDVTVQDDLERQGPINDAGPQGVLLPEEARGEEADDDHGEGQGGEEGLSFVWLGRDGRWVLCM